MEARVNPSPNRNDGRHAQASLSDALLIGAALFSVLTLFTSLTTAQTSGKTKLPRPRRLDLELTWHRDPHTGVLDVFPRKTGLGNDQEVVPLASRPIQATTRMVPVTCIVALQDGTPVPGLKREDFRILDDGVEQSISYFDSSSQPASVALVIDASPSVLRDAEEMKGAADALIDVLAPLDQAAVVDFSTHTYLQIPFSDVRELIRRAVARVDVRELLGDVGGSNIYEALWLSARNLFRERTGRKAIVLLTDGQDSGLGLTYDPASASLQSGKLSDRLTFDDVAQTLATEDIQVFAVSTENRPKVMTPEWFEAHRNSTLLTKSSRELGIPLYTLYLAEMVRRSGGQLYFLRETKTMADAFRTIAQRIRAEYTLAYYPSGASQRSERTGWHQLRVELVGYKNVNVIHRAAYYDPALR